MKRNQVSKKWDLELEPFQMSFFSSQARFPAMVSAWGTGKTMCGILKGLVLSNHPNNLGLIVRKNFTDLRDSTIKDFQRYTRIKVPSSKDVRLPNGSEIMFRHMDELAGIVQNVNLGWFLIEQAEEFESDQEFQKLRGRLRRENVPHQGVIIANTNGHNWIWRLWKNTDDSDYDLHEATTFDNRENLPEDFIKDLKKMEEQSPAHYRRYVLNSWEETDTADKIIPYRDLLESVDRQLNFFKPPKRVISCDPAEFGDDHTVIYAFEGPRIIATEYLLKKEPMETAGRIYRMHRNVHSSLIAVDEIGIGAGIRSRLHELGAPVMGVNSGALAEDKEHYKNLKAEMWFHAQDVFREGEVCLPDDDKLIEDLAAHTYAVNSKGQVVIEKKKDVKKRLGRSPDQGDAFVLGLWALRKAPEPDAPYIEESDSDIANSYSPKTLFV